MRKKSGLNSKFIVSVRSMKGTTELETVRIFDNINKVEMPSEYALRRGIVTFRNLEDLKEILNWNLNGDSSKFEFEWRMSTGKYSEGFAYIFD